jgi:hypothetical protein
MNPSEFRKFSYRLRHSERLVLAERDASGVFWYLATSCVPLEQIVHVKMDGRLCMITYANGVNLFVYLRKHRFKHRQAAHDRSTGVPVSCFWVPPTWNASCTPPQLWARASNLARPSVGPVTSWDFYDNRKKRPSALLCLPWTRMQAMFR